MSGYVVGIDLGTTNCAVSYAEPGEEPARKDFPIPQLVAQGTVEARPTLASYVYLPSRHVLPGGSLSLPWDEVIEFAVGAFARDEGAKVPDRLISSAKSWLSQEGVNRRDNILPWKAPEEVPRQSPVEASTNYLKHIVAAWKFTHPEEPLPDQQVVLTVPASFDAVARELTAEAARSAGLTSVTLLEEPQAAFYAWLEQAGESWRSLVKRGDLVLVCDIGGGTTDLSLIEVQEKEGELTLERVAVGSHILLGGDNMDLALAVAVRSRLKKEGTKLDAWQFGVLAHGCRQAKEQLLSSQAGDDFSLTIPGRGSSLVGGAINTEIGHDEVEKIILDGFFPRTASDELPVARHRVGLTELGLPYEADAAITRHLAAFLQGRGHPTAVLFNGGVLKATALRERIVEVVDGWLNEAEQPPLKVLDGTDLDLAVARGATRYGLVRQGQGIRIRGGLSRSYYIGVELAMPAVPGMEPPIKAVCVAPRGMEEGTSLEVPEQEFGLVLGELVEFPFLASTELEEDEAGTVHQEWDEEIQQLASVGSTLDGEGEAGQVVPVTLETVATEVGTLELWCVERDGKSRWKLEFEVREKES